MKLKLTLIAASLLVFATANTAAFAAAAQYADAKTEQAEAAKTNKAEVKKPVKRHNHMEEKTGMPMPEPRANSGKQGQMMDKGGHERMMRHDHMKEKR